MYAISAVIPPGIQPNRVGGCGLGVVNRCIKAFMHSLAHIKEGNKQGGPPCNYVHVGGNTVSRYCIFVRVKFSQTKANPCKP